MECGGGVKLVSDTHLGAYLPDLYIGMPIGKNWLFLYRNCNKRISHKFKQ